MKFFVPTNPDGGRYEPERADVLWQAARKAAEDEVGREALARRVYRLDHVHDGRELAAVVGERDPYYTSGDLIMAIIAFPGLYTIRTAGRGVFQVGDPILVGEGSVRYVEDFETDAADPTLGAPPSHP